MESFNKVLILSEQRFVDKVLPKICELKDTFIISIRDPGDDSFLPPSNIFKTWKFYDIEHEIGDYKPISFEQAKEIYEFIRSNFGKKLVVHCHAGIARSGAIGEFYWEMLGGGYKELSEKFTILPNPTVLYLLRIAEKQKDDSLKINFI